MSTKIVIWHANCLPRMIQNLIIFDTRHVNVLHIENLDVSQSGCRMKDVDVMTTDGNIGCQVCCQKTLYRLNLLLQNYLIFDFP
jgi:hypothetical protein